MRFVVTILLFVGVFTSCVRNPSELAQEQQLKEINPSGIKMNIKKALTVELKNNEPISFCLISTTPVTPRKKFYLQSGDSAETLESSLKVVSDDYGHLWTTGEQKMKLDRMVVPLMGYQRGQVCTFWLVSADRKTALKTSFVPYPLEGFANDGAEVSLTRLDFNATCVRCEGSYFKNNELLELTSVANNHKTHKVVECREGHFTTSLALPDPKSYGGVVTLQIKREDGECIDLSYPYGRDSFNKEYFVADPSKLQDEDRKRIEEAIEAYYNRNALTKDHVT